MDTIDDDMLAVFLAHLPEAMPRPGEARTDELRQELGLLLERAPGVVGEAQAALLAHVAGRLPASGDLLQALQRLHVEDLALAYRCGQGDADALAELEQQHLDVVPTALARMPDAAAHASEIAQQLRHRLLVGGGDQAPRITQYAGRGDLRSWIRVAAVRCAIDMLRGKQREVSLSDRLLDDLTSAGADPEIDHLKRTYHAEFRRAFADVLASLSSRDRNVLRYHFLQGLNIEQIGAIHSVHRATVARWLASLRKDLLESTRKALARRLQVGDAEVESIMRLIRSQLDASIERLL